LLELPISLLKHCGLDLKSTIEFRSYGLAAPISALIVDTVADFGPQMLQNSSDLDLRDQLCRKLVAMLDCSVWTDPDDIVNTLIPTPKRALNANDARQSKPFRSSVVISPR
jgi:hypothetical protein